MRVIEPLPSSGGTELFLSGKVLDFQVNFAAGRGQLGFVWAVQIEKLGFVVVPVAHYIGWGVPLVANSLNRDDFIPVLTDNEV